MLHCNRNYISEGIDLAKSNNRKEYMFRHYLFFNQWFKFQDSVCSGCHDLTMLSVNISNIAIITIKNVDYCCNIHNINKSEAINLLKNSVLEDRGYILKNVILNFSLFKAVFFTFLFSIYKTVDSMDIYKSLHIIIGAEMKNPEMLKFVPDHFKTKKMCKHAVKKFPDLLRYVLDQYKTP